MIKIQTSQEFTQDLLDGVERQRHLSPRDPEHEDMFVHEEAYNCVSVYWGGYEYNLDLGRIYRPEDLIWAAHHIGLKQWKYATGERMARLLAEVCFVKGWDRYCVVSHPNEAPMANHNKAEEREKMTPKLRYATIKRDGHRCRCCGLSVESGGVLHVDHIVAIANGGKTEPDNLQTLCSGCNLGKARA